VFAAPIAPTPASPGPSTSQGAFTRPAAPSGATGTGTVPGSRETHQRAERLARVLVSDILVYNQDVRDRALREGNLASALGAEINRAWELYKTKVDSQVLLSTSYFKDALNEILSNGQKLF